MAEKDIIAANPQGKASIALLGDLHAFKQHRSKAKDIPEWLADYFTSLLVLSASFNFKPVMNKTYYLYLDNDQWKLSLIEPQAWQEHTHTYFAECRMHDDMSWSIQPINDWHVHPELANKVQDAKVAFCNSLNSEAPVFETLPYYAAQLPYYQRLAAFGLSHSLKNSMQLKLGVENSKNLASKALLDHSRHAEILGLDFHKE